MPDLGPPLLSAGSNFLGAQLNAQAQQQQNRDDRRFSEYMYNRQKADAYEFWNAQNEYNTPAAQMQRFKDAGLNPNLVVGGSGAAGSGNAGAVNSPDFHPYSQKAPEFGNAISGAALGFLNSLYDLEIKKAQANNLQEQTNVIHQQGLLNAANVGNVEGRTKANAFQLQLDELFGADFQKARINQMHANTLMTTDENERRALLTASSLREAGERILNYQYQRAHSEADRRRIEEVAKYLRNSQVLQKLDINLRKKGINPSDSTFMRMGAQLLTKENVQRGADEISAAIKHVQDWISDFFTK